MATGALARRRARRGGGLLEAIRLEPGAEEVQGVEAHHLGAAGAGGMSRPTATIRGRRRHNLAFGVEAQP